MARSWPPIIVPATSCAAGPARNEPTTSPIIIEATSSQLAK